MNQPNYTLAHLLGTDFEILCESQEQQDEVVQILTKAGRTKWWWDTEEYMPLILAFEINRFTNNTISRSDCSLTNIPPADFIKQNTSPQSHPHDSVEGC